MSNFTVITDDEARLFNKLKSFYAEVIDLTYNHDSFKWPGVPDDLCAVVYPSKLGEALAKVDPDWVINRNNYK